MIDGRVSNLTYLGFYASWNDSAVTPHFSGHPRETVT